MAYPNPARWSLAYSHGAVAFMRDRSRNNAFFLRMVDLARRKLVWEQELYREFELFRDCEFFFQFPSDHMMIGFCFADSGEAGAFYQKIQLRNSISSQSKPKPKPPAQQQPEQHRHRHKKRKKPIDKSTIGRPSDFRHISHVGYTPGVGIQTDNIPEDWKKILKQAGVEDEQLRDENTANFIFEFLGKRGGGVNGGNSAQTRPYQQRNPPPLLPSRPASSSTSKPPPPPRPAVPASKRSSLSASSPSAGYRAVGAAVGDISPSVSNHTRSAIRPPPRPPTTRHVTSAEPPKLPETGPPPLPSDAPPLPSGPTSSSMKPPPLPPGRPPTSPPATSAADMGDGVHSPRKHSSPDTSVMAAAAPPPPPPPAPAPLEDMSQLKIQPKSPESNANLVGGGDNPRDQLLASIRNAGGGKSLLKPVADREIGSGGGGGGGSNAGSTGDIAAALRQALLNRQNAILGDDNSLGSDDGDDGDGAGSDETDLSDDSW